MNKAIRQVTSCYVLHTLWAHSLFVAMSLSAARPKTDDASWRVSGRGGSGGGEAQAAVSVMAVRALVWRMRFPYGPTDSHAAPWAWGGGASLTLHRCAGPEVGRLQVILQIKRPSLEPHTCRGTELKHWTRSLRSYSFQQITLSFQQGKDQFFLP